MFVGEHMVSLKVVSMGSFSRSAAVTSRAEWISVSSSGQHPTAKASTEVKPMLAPNLRNPVY
jgi:hypothetical protein